MDLDDDLLAILDEPLDLVEDEDRPTQWSNALDCAILHESAQTVIASADSSIPDAVQLLLDLERAVDLVYTSLRALMASLIPTYETFAKQMTHLQAAQVLRVHVTTPGDYSSLEPFLTDQQVMLVRVSSEMSKGPPITPTAAQKAQATSQTDFLMALDAETLALEAWAKRYVPMRYPSLWTLLDSPRATIVLAAAIPTHAGAVAGWNAASVKMAGRDHRLTTRPAGGVVADVAAALLAGHLDDKKLCGQIVQTLAEKARLAVQYDLGHAGQATEYGVELRAKVLAEVERKLKPGVKKSIRILKPPIEKKRNRRAGKKFNKRRERTQMTALRTMASRVTFGAAEGDYGEVGLGQVGQNRRAVMEAAAENKKSVG